MQIASFNRSKKLIVFFAIIIFFSVVSLFVANASFMVSNEIYQGVSVGDVSVGGLSREAASVSIAAAFKSRTVQPIFITYQDQKWPIDTGMVDLQQDAPRLAMEAYNIGRTGSIIARIQERYLTLNQGYTVPLTLSLNEKKLQSILSGIASSLDQESQNAVLRQSGSSVIITPEVIGRKVNVVQAFTDLQNKLASEFTFSYPLPVSEIVPEITVKDFAGIDGVIASYTTQFNTADQNRTQNIVIASNGLNGTLVHSGANFSFNAVTGLRIAQYGYKEAPVFINGKLVPDWGGGVCQVSSTLYNAALLSDMKITERSSHFQPPGYVPLGQDATVADNQLDLKFVNTSSSSLFITSEVYGNQITVQMLGKRLENSPEIYIVATDKKVIEPNTVIKQDPELELGKEVIEDPGQKGFLVTTYRVKTLNGKEISREYLATDDFPPAEKIVRVGTKILSPKAPHK